jgi:hypothetical protein
MSLLDLRKFDFPPLSRMVQKIDEGRFDKSICYDYLTDLINNVLEYFGENWKSTTIVDAAEAIYSDYYYLTFADWKLLAQRIKSSYYGKVYGKFTPAVLMDWIGRYAGEWTQVSVDISISGHDSHRKLIDSRERKEKEAELISMHTMYHKLLSNEKE